MSDPDARDTAVPVPAPAPYPYWFMAKKYGWGWSRATTWQGWVTLTVFFTLMTLGVVWVMPQFGTPLFLIYTAVLVAGLLAVCLAKGEPAKWRWGAGPPVPPRQPPTPPV